MHEGLEGNQNIRSGFSEHFHPDPEKLRDPLETLLEELGPDKAFDKLVAQLEDNPNDPELRRQANLLVNRLEDLLPRLKEKTNH